MSYLSDLLGDSYKEGMTEEEISTALQAAGAGQNNDAEINRLKAQLSKANSEAADYKKQLRGKQTADEAAAAEQKATMDKLTQENTDLKANLNAAKTKIKAAFSGHVLSHRVYLTNAVSNGAPSGGAWFDSEVELMTERMVYGCPVHSPMGDGQKDPWSAMHNYTVEKSQLPLFALNPAAIATRYDYWLRDVVTAATFASVDGAGCAGSYGASYSNGVRPAFCIC